MCCQCPTRRRLCTTLWRSERFTESHPFFQSLRFLSLWALNKAMGCHCRSPSPTSPQGEMRQYKA